jgi:MFS family permease
MSLFAIAFFGASLLFPLYFQQVRGEDALHAGLLLAPQGLGAMLTMPIAGVLADRIGPGKVVLVGIVVDTIGMGLFTQLGAGTSYGYIIAALVVMGLGMGATMMPIMSAALATLTNHSIARGSTLMNITPQVAASIGTALFSVLLTNGFNGSPAVQAAGAIAETKRQGPDAVGAVLNKLGISPDQVPALVQHALHDMGGAFANVFVVATILIGCCLIPAFFLPRKKPEQAVDPAAMMGH